jgi:hypothetical protein
LERGSSGNPSNRRATDTELPSDGPNAKTVSERNFDCGFGRCPWSAELLALCPDPIKPGNYPSSDHSALEFREHAKHLEHGPPGWRRCVEPLLMQEEIDPKRVQLGKEVH